jgi:competence protein ComEC
VIRKHPLSAALSGVAVLAAATAFLAACLPLDPSPAETAVPPAGTRAPRPPLTILFLDVGQGDAALVRSPGGQALLIDGGENREDAEKIILPALRAWGCQRLDSLVISHPDQDHIGGLPTVVESFPVGQVVLTGQIHTTQTYEQLLTLIRDKKIPAVKARGGMQLDLDPAITVALLGPDDAAVESDDTNNASVVIRLTYGDVSILFTGDAEAQEEETILSSGADVEAQVLKVAHHGSQAASSRRWLQAVAPQVAVISVAAGGPYEHPHRDVLARLRQANVIVYRTDQHGTVMVHSDGETFQVFTER